MKKQIKADINNVKKTSAELFDIRALLKKFSYFKKFKNSKLFKKSSNLGDIEMPFNPANELIMLIALEKFSDLKKTKLKETKIKVIKTPIYLN